MDLIELDGHRVGTQLRTAALPIKQCPSVGPLAEVRGDDQAAKDASSCASCASVQTERRRAPTLADEGLKRVSNQIAVLDFSIYASQLETIVLYTIAAVLLALWVLGLATSFTAGGLVHALLVIAVIVIVWQLMTGRRVG